MNDTTIAVRAAVRDALTNLQAAVSAGYEPSTGICNAVRERLSVAERNAEPCYMYLLAQLAADWPEYSGDNLFPVPSYTPGIGPVSIYPIMKARGLLWAERSPYGSARRRLLAFMLKKLTNQQTRTPTTTQEN